MSIGNLIIHFIDSLLSKLLLRLRQVMQTWRIGGQYERRLLKVWKYFSFWLFQTNVMFTDMMYLNFLSNSNNFCFILDLIIVALIRFCLFLPCPYFNSNNEEFFSDEYATLDEVSEVTSPGPSSRVPLMHDASLCYALLTFGYLTLISHRGVCLILRNFCNTVRINC